MSNYKTGGDSHLNKSQLRALQISEEFKNLSREHLLTFVNGISNPEPPHYQMIDGQISPSLELVTLKVGAIQYDFGNVQFCKSSEVNQVKIVYENRSVNQHLGKPYQGDDKANPSIVPILDDVYIDLVYLWKAKYDAIMLLMYQTNDIRRYAHNALNIPAPKIQVGLSIIAQQEANGKVNGNSGITYSKKREHGEPVLRHPVNKRLKLGLDSIPSSVKMEVFSRIPEQFKLELFDSVTRAALPNFEDLMTASWNVVELCAYTPSSKTLNACINELRNVLLQIEKSYGRGLPERQSKQGTSRPADQNIGQEQSGQAQRNDNLQELPALNRFRQGQEAYQNVNDLSPNITLAQNGGNTGKPSFPKSRVIPMQKTIHSQVQSSDNDLLVNGGNYASQNTAHMPAKGVSERSPSEHRIDGSFIIPEHKTATSDADLSTEWLNCEGTQSASKHKLQEIASVVEETRSVQFPPSYEDAVRRKASSVHAQTSTLNQSSPVRYISLNSLRHPIASTPPGSKTSAPSSEQEQARRHPAADLEQQLKARGEELKRIEQRHQHQTTPKSANRNNAARQFPQNHPSPIQIDSSTSPHSSRRESTTPHETPAKTKKSEIIQLDGEEEEDRKESSVSPSSEASASTQDSCGLVRGVFLGDSRLGVRKTPTGTGTAPMAPMMHVVGKEGTGEESVVGNRDGDEAEAEAGGD
ncbi:hypothetical protein B0J11DRAFT_593104 [Dendryphion nanum]|uniref:Uncharacterized protein n=1 Tax=Dendryphion nanum TaxID=256645 RepID=A0A9P9IDQ9_9PLEO|nr:hypothetical protein B0J11DRAFT_593104 [Dendryphion nanum]